MHNVARLLSDTSHGTFCCVQRFTNCGGCIFPCCTLIFGENKLILQRSSVSVLLLAKLGLGKLAESDDHITTFESGVSLAKCFVRDRARERRKDVYRAPLDSLHPFLLRIFKPGFFHKSVSFSCPQLEWQTFDYRRWNYHTRNCRWRRTTWCSMTPC